MKQYDKLAQRNARHRNASRYVDLDEALFGIAHVHHERIGSSHKASRREVNKLIILMRSAYKQAARAAGLTVNHYDAKIYALRAVFMHYCKLLGLVVSYGKDEFESPFLQSMGMHTVLSTKPEFNRWQGVLSRLALPKTISPINTKE